MSSVAFLEKHPKFVRSGWLYKQGGSVKTVTKRYCVLFGNELFYFKQPDDDEHKGSIVLLKPVWGIEEAVEYQKKGTFGKPQVLKNCIVIIGTKREYKFWSDSHIIAEEWVESINLTLQKMQIGKREEVVEDDDDDDGEIIHDGSISRGNFIIENSYGADIEGNEDIWQSSQNNQKIDKKSQEEQLLQSCINEKDGFDVQFYNIQSDFVTHQSLRPTIWTVEPYSRRKKRNLSTMTLEKAVLQASPGDTIFLKLGKHFITRTLYIDRSVEIVGETSDRHSQAEVVMLQEEEHALAVAQPILCLIAPFVKITNVRFLYACIPSEIVIGGNDDNDVVYDDFAIDSRTALNQMLNAGIDTVISQRKSLGVHLTKSVLQISRGQLIIQKCQVAFMQTANTKRIQSAYDGMFLCGSSQVLLFECELACCKHGISAAVQASVIVNDCVIRDMTLHGILVTQKAQLVLQSSELLRNGRCGICFLNHSGGIVRQCKFRSCTLSVNDHAKPEISQNVFSYPANNEQSENMQTQTSLVVFGGSSTGEFSFNTLTCSSINGNGTAPVLCLCIMDQANVTVVSNNFKREGGDGLEPFALVTGKAQVIVPDEKQRIANREFIKCYEQGRMIVAL